MSDDHRIRLRRDESPQSVDGNVRDDKTAVVVGKKEFSATDVWSRQHRFSEIDENRC